MYILDEPSIGLHQRDNQRLLDTLMNLRNLGNTVLVVEHDSEAIMAADYVVDLGPGAGVHGGQVVAQGTPKEILANSGVADGPIPVGQARDSAAVRAPRVRPAARVSRGRRARQQLEGRRRRDPRRPDHVRDRRVGLGQEHARQRHDLSDRGARTSTAAPRSPRRYGKAIGLQHFDYVIDISQAPIGRTPRSNPATYSGLLDADPRPVRASARIARARLRARPLQLQRERRPLRDLPRRRRHQGRDALPARRLRAVRHLRRQALQPRDARHSVQGEEHLRGA